MIGPRERLQRGPDRSTAARDRAGPMRARCQVELSPFEA